MQTLTIGAYRATLAPTRNVGDFTAKLAKCNGKSRRLPLRDLRTKAGFPVFEPGMSTAEYVRLYSSGDGSQLKSWEWAQLNEEPCTLYSGEDACETLPDGFDTWEDFDAAAEMASADAEPVDATEPVAPDDAIAPAIVASAELDAPAPAARAEPYPGGEPAAATVYRVHLATAAHSRAINPAFKGYRRPRSAGMLADFAAPDVHAHRSAIARSVRAERAKRASLEGSEPQRMADALRARIAPTADALREAAAELEARAARVPIERADDYRGAAAMLRADADAAPGIVPGFASRGARMLQAAITRSAARGIEVGAGGAPLATHSQTSPSADPLATHSAADNGFAHRVATAAAFISSGRNPSRAFSNCLEMYDGAAVAVALMRRAEKRPGSKMAANIWRYLCRAATESSAAEQPADMSLAEWSRVLIQRAQSESDAMRTTPLPSESETDPLPADSGASPAEAKREADRAAALADAMARFTRGARVTAEPAHYFDGQPVAGWPNAQFLGTVRECFDNHGTATVRVKWDSGRTDLTAAARLTIVPLSGESEPAPLPGESARVFSVIVARPGKRALQYAPVGGKTALANMLMMSTRGFECIARTTANEITEDLTAPEMLALYGALSDPVPGDTKPEAPEDDETIPAPLDGLDVAELDDMVEFERAGGIAQPIAPAYRDDAPRATPTPSLRISPSDPRARIPARFAPVYLLQA